MSQLMVTSAVTSAMPINTVNFNWKIENFSAKLKTFGNTGFESPELKVLSHFEGKVHSLKLRVKQDESGYPIQNSPIPIINEGGVNKPVIDFTLVKVEVINTPVYLYFGLAGSLDMNIEGRNFSGGFGALDNADFPIFEQKWVFRNKTALITTTLMFGGGVAIPLRFTGFCMSNRLQTVEMRVKLTIPGLVVNSISHLPIQQTARDIGITRLVSDITSLLIRADEYADFSIICEGRIFPCHEAILRARSPVFDKMFQQEMKEKTTRMMTVEDVGTNTMDAVLEYIYTGNITKEVDNESEIIYIGDKYDIDGLLKLRFQKLPELEDHMVVDILFVADRHDLEDFKKVIMQRIQMNKPKFVKNEYFLEKLRESPDLLLEFFQL
eukprot:GFUD01024545.1.p1 GENE.GFUD01024545.1~~GFUD01024545.1.p1  ORF type:complete len:403 (-),score=82.35 GFUD01024545.1:64-1206(-)